MVNIFLDIGIIIVAAGAFGYLARLCRQPLIPAFILAGIYIGPIQGLITDREIISSISEIGIALLLFSAGLELNLRKLRDVGNVAILGALSHMIVLFTAGLVIFRMLGYDTITSIYIGLILIFSSTLVVIKLLSDRKELDTLHGRIIIGILLVQDVVAIIALSILSSLGTGTPGLVFLMFVQGGIVMFAGYALATLAFGSIFKFAAKSDEHLFLLSIFMLFTFALIFYEIGFSIAIGAFIAGILIGHLPYRLEILGQVKGIKEFFSIIFFVSIGLSLTAINFTTMALPLLILFFMIILLVPFSIMFMLAIFGYKRRTAFMASISLSQVSEFSLIMVSVGLLNGQISQEIYSLTILLALLTIVTTSYAIKYSECLYRTVGRKLTFFEIINPNSKEKLGYEKQGEKYEAVLVGYDRIGYGIFKRLKELGKHVLIVDLNPDIIHRLMAEKTPCLYGDISDQEILDRVKPEHLKIVISTVPKHDDNKLLLATLRRKNPDATIILTAYDSSEAMELYSMGADYVILPHFLGGEHLGVILNKLTGKLKEKVKIKVAHIKAIEERRKRHPHHI